MDIDQALSFLKVHQPLPNDEEVNLEDIRRLDEVRKYFIKIPSPECISLFLNVFGQGSGFGVYQRVEDVIKQFSNEEVVPHLVKSLKNAHKGVRYWSAQIASSFPDSRLIEPLSLMVNEQDSDLRCAAYLALCEINNASVLLILKNALQNEKETENYDILKDIIENYELFFN